MKVTFTIQNIDKAVEKYFLNLSLIIKENVCTADNY